MSNCQQKLSTVQIQMHARSSLSPSLSIEAVSVFGRFCLRNCDSKSVFSLKNVPDGVRDVTATALALITSTLTTNIYN